VANKVINIVGWTFVAVFAVLFWFIYLAESETQDAVIWFVLNLVFGFWGWGAALFKLVVGSLLIWFASSRAARGAVLWPYPVGIAGLLLAALGLMGLLGEFLSLLIGVLLG
jgi:hypothetical protein